MYKVLEKNSFHKTGFQLLKLAKSVESGILPTILLQISLEVAAAFASLILSAGMIDALTGKAYRQAAAYALLLLAVELLAGILGNFLKKVERKMHIRCTEGFYIMRREKALSLDYEILENPKVLEKIKYVERTESMYGGLGQLAVYYGNLLKSVLVMLLSVGMTVSMCMKRPELQGGFLSIAANPWISLLLLVFAIVGNGVVLGKAGEELTRQEQDMVEQHAGVENKCSYLMEGVLTNYKAGKVVRIFDMSEMLLKNVRTEDYKEREYFKKSGDIHRKIDETNVVVNSAFSLLSYLLAAVKVLSGAITVGAFTKYAGALTQFGTAYGDFQTANARIQQICTYMQEFLDFMATENVHEKGSIPVEKRLDGEFEIAFEDVSFHYPGSKELVLSHVNCKLTTKHKMAVVGRNGAGKTTFIKLLCRLYEPTEGRITLNGVDIRKYSEEEYRDLFGVVFQDFKLFSFPIWENIVAGYEKDEAKIWKCLTQAGIDERVRAMDAGIDTPLYKENAKDGIEISGGEAQKLALTRALYKDAPFVILDEPTAALDPISEAEVYAGFDAMVKEKTSVYISHRMSSCRFCDDIIVFDAGKIVERGSHDALLKKQGQYAKMWEAQAKYYAS